MSAVQRSIFLQLDQPLTSSLSSYKLCFRDSVGIDVISYSDIFRLTKQNDGILSEFCWGKDLAIYTKTQQKEEKGYRLRGEGDKIRVIDLRFERGQVVGLRKARRRQDVPLKCMFLG